MGEAWSSPRQPGEDSSEYPWLAIGELNRQCRLTALTASSEVCLYPSLVKVSGGMIDVMIDMMDTAVLAQLQNTKATWPA